MAFVEQRCPDLCWGLIAEPFAVQHVDDLVDLGWGERSMRQWSWCWRPLHGWREVSPVVRCPGTSHCLAGGDSRDLAVGEFVDCRVDDVV